jgi:DNA-binding NarL/FixJ family response regulator
VIADPHPLYRRGLADAIADRSRLELVGEATDTDEAVAEVTRLSPEVAIVELNLPGGDAPGLVERIAGETKARVLLLCGREDAGAIYAAVEAGASGCLFKEADAEEITEAIAAMARGEASFCTRAGELIARQIQLRRNREDARLSERERRILTLTADGFSSEQIGQELSLSQSTVKNDLSHIYAKLEVSCAAAAVSEALRLGMLG